MDRRPILHFGKATYGGVRIDGLKTKNIGYQRQRRVWGTHTVCSFGLVYADFIGAHHPLIALARLACYAPLGENAYPFCFNPDPGENVLKTIQE